MLAQHGRKRILKEHLQDLHRRHRPNLISSTPNMQTMWREKSLKTPN